MLNHGIRMHAKENQKPPYEQKAVAPGEIDRYLVSKMFLGSVQSDLRGTLTESVAGSELPDTSDELGETTVAEGEADDHLRVVDAAGSDVEHGQNPRRRREAEQTQRRRVGELAVVDGEGRLRLVKSVAAS